MADEKQYNLGESEGLIKALAYFNYLRSKGSTIGMRDILPSRTNTQNKSLHLFFRLMAESLNNHGEYYHYQNYRGEMVEIQWTGDMIKHYIWKPLQTEMLGKESTTQLTTKEIDPIYETLVQFYANKGIEFFFPSRFSQFLDQMK